MPGPKDSGLKGENVTGLNELQVDGQTELDGGLIVYGPTFFHGPVFPKADSPQSTNVFNNTITVTTAGFAARISVGITSGQWNPASSPNSPIMAFDTVEQDTKGITSISTHGIIAPVTGMWLIALVAEFKANSSTFSNAATSTTYSFISSAAYYTFASSASPHTDAASILGGPADGFTDYGSGHSIILFANKGDHIAVFADTGQSQTGFTAYASFCLVG